MVTSVCDFTNLLARFPVVRDDLLANASSCDPHTIALAGFQLAAPDQKYASQHREFIRCRCDGELSDDSLAEHGKASTTWREFSCFCLGYLLGRYQDGGIDDREFAVADAQLAGFMFLHAPTIAALSGTAEKED